LHACPSGVEALLLELLVNDAKVEMLQLAETVFEKDVLGIDKLISSIRGILEVDSRWLILQTSHLKSFHGYFILMAV
jgi:hypothetical protein